MNKRLPALVFLALAAVIAPATAQDTYRCGDSYSRNPCPGGTLVPSEDARSAAQRSQASEDAQRVAQSADAMEKARLKEEAKPVASYIPAPKNEAAAPDTKPKQLSKPKKPEFFTATVPRKPGQGAPKPKKKAKKKNA